MQMWYQNSLHYDSNYKSMRLLNKNRHHTTNPQPILQENLARQQNYCKNRRDSMPAPSIIVTHHTRRQSCPEVLFQGNNKMPAKIQDQKSTLHISTRGTCDSGRQNNEQRDQLEWKILTLRQLKDLKNQIVREHKAQGGEQKGQKMFVSIAKNNRNSFVKEGFRNVGPKLCEIGAQQSLLRSISNKKNIVNRVQGQIVQKMQSFTFFCN